MASYYDIENGLIELTMEKQDKQGDAGGKAAVLAVLCGKPVRPADCPAVRGHGDGFSGVSGLYPDHRLGAALPAL